MPYVVTDKIHFLSEASKILSSSLDYNVTLAIVAKLLVTNVADFCIIDILDGHKMNRLAVSVSDSSKKSLSQEMLHFLPNPKNKMAIYDAAKRRAPIIIKKATEKWLSSVSNIKGERDTIIELGLNSHIFVPLISRGDVIGVLTLASMDPTFSYEGEDAIFLEELATRIALAVDKARLYAEAQRALQTRDEFLSIASHELKTPLTSILLNLQGILKKISKTKGNSKELQEIKRKVEICKSQSERMSRLINDLLNVSVTSTGRFTIEREKMDLVEVVKDAIVHFKAQLKKDGTTIVFEPIEPIVGRWDKVRIEQVVSNLISNAIKYGLKKPISIKLSKSMKEAVLAVEDQGIGIEPQHKDLIFQRFRRGNYPRDISGLGVGLYISKQIIEAHRGTLTVKSEVGKGSTFTATLPLKIS